MADPVLWPMAVQHAVCLHNHVPNPSTGLAPTDIFSKTCWPQSKLHDLHIWGSPACLLNHTIADGKKIPKWKPCSQCVISMGLLPWHASSVLLVLNPATGAIMTGCHVIFDDWFATVATSPDQLPDFNSVEWAQTFGDSACQHPFDEDVPPPHEEASSHHANSIAHAMDDATPPVPLPGPPPAQHPTVPTNLVPQGSLEHHSLPQVTSSMLSPLREMPNLRETLAPREMPALRETPVSSPRETTVPVPPLRETESLNEREKSPVQETTSCCRSPRLAQGPHIQEENAPCSFTRSG